MHNDKNGINGGSATSNINNNNYGNDHDKSSTTNSGSNDKKKQSNNVDDSTVKDSTKEGSYDSSTMKDGGSGPALEDGPIDSTIDKSNKNNNKLNNKPSVSKSIGGDVGNRDVKYDSGGSISNNNNSSNNASCLEFWLADTMKHSWVTTNGVSTEYFITDAYGSRLYDFGSYCLASSSEKEMCAVCLFDGNYLWRVSGVYNQSNNGVAWEFCDTRGGSGMELYFTIENGNCIPGEIIMMNHAVYDEITTLSTDISTMRNEISTYKSNVELQGTMLLSGVEEHVLSPKEMLLLQHIILQECVESLSTVDRLNRRGSIDPNDVIIRQLQQNEPVDESVVSEHRDRLLLLSHTIANDAIVDNIKGKDDEKESISEKDESITTTLDSYKYSSYVFIGFQVRFSAEEYGYSADKDNEIRNLEQHFNNHFSKSLESGVLLSKVKYAAKKRHLPQFTNLHSITIRHFHAIVLRQKENIQFGFFDIKFSFLVVFVIMLSGLFLINLLRRYNGYQLNQKNKNYSHSKSPTNNHGEEDQWTNKLRQPFMSFIDADVNNESDEILSSKNTLIDTKNNYVKKFTPIQTLPLASIHTYFNTNNISSSNENSDDRHSINL